MTSILPLRCFLFLLPNYTHVYEIIMQWIFFYLDKRELLQHEYSQPPILPSPHFRWVVNLCKDLLSDIFWEIGTDRQVCGSSFRFAVANFMQHTPFF